MLLRLLLRLDSDVIGMLLLLLRRHPDIISVLLLDSDVIAILVQQSSDFPAALVGILGAVDRPAVGREGRRSNGLLLQVLLQLLLLLLERLKSRLSWRRRMIGSGGDEGAVRRVRSGRTRRGGVARGLARRR